MPYYDTVTNVLEGQIKLADGTWTAIRTGSSNALSRKYLGVYNSSNKRIYLSTDNTADVTHCRRMNAGTERIFPYSDKVTLYGQTTGSVGGARITVTEECG